ncbi:MAG: class I SAM-dependent methyltransferase [Deltaproteobacteria bacterium]|nr:class I SAM-dependent methyltransferase [Deltaproteobacteria bacterium]
MDRIKELVRQHWDWRAADFDKEASHGLLNDTQSQAWHGLMSRVAGGVALDALDVGCGTGFLSLLLAKLGHRVTGIDVAEAMLAMARGKAAAQGLTVNFHSADAETPALPAGSFDLIIERHVLWTLPHPASALDSWHHLLRRGGQLVLIEGQWEGMKPRDEYTEIYDRLPLFGGRPDQEIAELIRSRGFNTVITEPLMEPELWTEPPTHPRYLVTARA